MVDIYKNKLRLLYHKFFYRIHSLYSFKNKYYQDIIKEPYESILVPLDLIEYQIGNARLLPVRSVETVFFNKVRVAGVICNGNWDLQKIKFNHTRSYISFIERYVEGKEWEETIYYNRFVDAIEQNNEGVRRGCNTWEEYKSIHLLKWDRLYNDIKKNGYKNHNELNKLPQNEIEVCISRLGEVLFVDGRHRLAIAKLLNLDEIPVIVDVWHKKYIDSLNIKCRLTPSEAFKPIIEKYLEDYLTRKNE